MNINEDLIVAVVCFGFSIGIITIGICLYLMIRSKMPLWVTAGRPAFENPFNNRSLTRREIIENVLMFVAFAILHVVYTLYSEENIRQGAEWLSSWLGFS